MRKPTRKVRTPAKRGGTTRRTSKAQAKSTSSRKSAPKKGYERGAAGFRKAAEKKARQDEEYERMRNTPYDFRLKPGEEAEVVILDEGDPFFISLHKVKNSQGRWEDAVCIADTGATCPLCQSLGKDGSYTMVLTVLDRRPYTIKNGPNAGKTIKASRKLFKVKSRNLPKFERQFKKHKGNMRGLKVLCHRDGEKEAAIGEDLEFGSKVKENVLAKYGENAQVAPYTDIFEIPSAKELAKRYNLSMDGVPGQEEFEEDDEEDEYDEEDVGWNKK